MEQKEKKEEGRGKRWKRILLLFLFLLIIELIAYWQHILVSLGSYLIYEEPPRKGDLIVVLGGWDDRVVRAREAADLYHKGLAPKIFVTRPERPLGWKMLAEKGARPFEAREGMIRALKSFGVDPKAIETVEKEVSCTEDEAKVVRDWVKDKDYRVILLVTSRYHSRRAWIIFRDALEGKARVVSLPSRYDDFRPEGWWKRRKDLKRVVFEYEKLLYYLLEKTF